MWSTTKTIKFYWSFQNLYDNNNHNLINFHLNFSFSFFIFLNFCIHFLISPRATIVLLYLNLSSFFTELIPRPARSCEDPPLYLRLRMGKPINKTIPRTTPLMSYGKKKMRPEYWFSVPKNRVDELYKFLQAWVPHLYGELDEEKVSSWFITKFCF